MVTMCMATTKECYRLYLVGGLDSRPAPVGTLAGDYAGDIGAIEI